MAAVAIFVSPASPLATPVIYADRVGDLNAQISQDKSQANTLHGQANTLANKLASINAQVSQLSAQIKANKAKVIELNQQIDDAKVQLAAKKQILDENVRQIYQQSQITPLEMLASSKNFSEFVDRQQYLDRIKDHIQEAAAAVQKLKSEMESQQTALNKAIQDQNIQQNVLAASQAEQANLLAQTQGQESAYQASIARKLSERDQIIAAQQAAAQRLLSGGATSGTTGSFAFKNLSGLSGCGAGDYTLCGPQDSYIDQWDLFNRECVSYAAFTITNRFHKSVPDFNGHGNAYEWPSYLSGLQYSMDFGNNPHVGDAAIAAKSRDMPYGHAMVVEQVYGDGWVKVSQYNFGYPGGMYSTMDAKVSGLTFIHF